MFVTYENHRNPHVAIHRAGCGQIAKHGGEHKYGQGAYREHATYLDAEQYAHSTDLELIICSYCKPSPPVLENVTSSVSVERTIRDIAIELNAKQGSIKSVICKTCARNSKDSVAALEGAYLATRPYSTLMRSTMAAVPNFNSTLGLIDRTPRHYATALRSHSKRIRRFQTSMFSGRKCDCSTSF